ncbi:tetratricopeptide repeat protein [Nocardiopsis sp. NPDC101807]|uniref:tetratricopeptide repeat protein n=1 Tax=Nocardiopsis sp. NPDC101807 TaxID=3364339 RepID=UPI003809A3CB
MDSPPPPDRRPGAGTSPHGNRVQGHVSGTSVQAGTVHGGIHVFAPPPRAVPRQLPAPPAVYVDRAAESAQIATAVSRAHASARNALVVVTGPAGVGKSALAADFLHAHADLGRDGQLFVDLAGFSPGPPADPHELLEALLLSMEGDLRSVPADFGTRAAWWRSATANTRVSLLLDNALSAAQVRALLPGGHQGTVIVTTRVHLAGLRLHGADFVDVPPLPEDDGVELLTRLSGRPAAGEADQAAMCRVVELCAGLPVAMCTVAVGESVYRRSSWTRVERELQDSEDRLTRLSAASERLGEDMSVQGAFDVSYAMLAPGPARLYRRLSWHPGPDATALTAARLLDCSEEDAEILLADLARQAMLSEHAPGRYRFHDLLRLHAADRARTEESDGDRAEAVRRLLTAFGDVSVGADAVLRPYAGTPPDADAPSPFEDAAGALAWLDAERENLAALAEHAAAHGRPALAVRLVEGLWPLFLHRGHAALWFRAATAAVRAARELGDRRTEGRLLNKRSLGHRQLGRPEEALTDLEGAEALWHELGDPKRIALTRQQRGALCLRTGRIPEAIAHLRETLVMDERTGDGHNMAVTLFMLGQAHLADGGPERALPLLHRALPLLAEDPYNGARARIVLGSALTALAEPDRARRELREALAVMREHGSASGQAEALEALGGLAENRGDAAEARDLYEQALRLLPPHDPAGIRVGQRLAGLEGP